MIKTASRSPDFVVERSCKKSQLLWSRSNILIALYQFDILFQLFIIMSRVGIKSLNHAIAILASHCLVVSGGALIQTN
jgi:hypothetical protein